jgi:membrane protein implicated in regulation of membrane protease activity
MDGLSHTQWLIWLAAALAAGLIEIVTLGFFALMIAGAALLAGVSAMLGAPVTVQVIVFAVSSAGLLFTARPALRHWAARTPGTPMNTDALVGQDARVLEPVTHETGLVKLAGEVWTARMVEEHGGLEVGSDVQVIRIDGATAVVAAKPASADNP